MAKLSKTILISDTQLEALIKKVATKKLSNADWELLHALLTAYQFVLNMLKYQKTTLHKLRDLLFGQRTEKEKSKIEGDDDDDDPLPPPSPGDPGPPSSIALLPSIFNQIQTPNSKTPGHGRKGHLFWEKAPHILHAHQVLQAGSPCPKCPHGTLHRYATPATWVRFVGQAPLSTEVHELERLRCGACTEVFTATAPEHLKRYPTATPEARAVAAILKYQAATPFNRLATVQKSFGYPIPRTSLWTLCQEMAGSLLGIFKEMNEQGAQGDLLQNDDTVVRILSLMKENKTAKEAGIELSRKGMFTTGIISRVKEHKIYLFFSSRKHAGENLADLLDKRETGLSPPTQVCDASDMNTTFGNHKTDLGGCHDHARRKFYEIKNSFPSSCGYALREWKIIYRTDKMAKQQNLSPEDRLLLHQQRSQPALERLKAWFEKMIQEKGVDPAGHLAKAMQYFLNHYPELTLFLRKADVPISNCACEQALKIPIGVRKMAYFYKTLTGAKVGDIILSLIATCLGAGVNVFDYFVAVQDYSEEVKKNPELWLPWNYQQQLASA